MKRLITLFFVFSSFLAVYAQVLPNGGFEDWDTTLLFQEPTDYNSTNPFTLLNDGINTTTLVQGMTPQDSAVHLETKRGIGRGALWAGTFGNLNYFTRQGGTAFSGQPDSISYRVNYKIQPGDTAIMTIVFYAQGATRPFAGTNVYLTGSSNGWVEVTQAMDFPVNKPPAAYIFQCSSSKSDASAVEGSILEIDYFYLNSPEQIDNADFEQWDDTNFEDPNGFRSLNAFSAALGAPVGVTKDTAAIEGEYCARIETKLIQIGTNVIDLGFLQSGETDNPYLPISKLPAALDGMYKYAPAANTDVGVVVLIMVSNHPPTPERRDTIAIPLSEAVDWTKFEINLQPLNLPVPDSFALYMFASNPDQPVQQSVLTLDGLKFVPITSVNEPGKAQDKEWSISPNPVRDYFVILGLEEDDSPAKVSVFDQKGRILQKSASYHAGEKLFVGDYPRGYYSVRIQQKDYMKAFLFYKN